MTLLAVLFSVMSEEEILNTKEDQGYSDVIINEDHTVTLTMTEEKHTKIVNDLKVDIDHSIDDLVNCTKSDLTQAYYYHFFIGLSEGEIKVDFTYVYVASGETFKTKSYPKIE